jgi:hypothetical protein
MSFQARFLCGAAFLGMLVLGLGYTYESHRILTARKSSAAEFAAPSEMAATLERSRVKKELVRELLAGRISLSDLAEHFRVLDEASPAVVKALECDFPNVSPGQRPLWSAVRYTMNYLEDEKPDQSPSVLAAVVAEFCGITSSHTQPPRPICTAVAV